MVKLNVWAVLVGIIAGGMALALPGSAWSAQNGDELLSWARDVFSPIPTEPPEIPGNGYGPARVELGKMLYFDPRLSEGHNISCNTCHQIGLGGVDMLETSIGHHWQKGGRNAPTVLNAVFNTAQFWDGRAHDLREQAGGPLVNPVEMAITEDHAIEMLAGIPGYRPYFTAAFPGETDPIALENVLKAIEAFEATLITPNAPFDRYLAGETEALNEMEREGLGMFLENGCAACHSGMNIGGEQYQPFGVVEKPHASLLPPDDKGRFQVTRSEGDEFVFKVPSLRNVERTLPYFHTGKVWDLRQAVEIMGATQLGIHLTPEEADKITAFLRTLTGDQPLVTYPILPTSVDTTPRPQP